MTIMMTEAEQPLHRKATADCSALTPPNTTEKQVYPPRRSPPPPSACVAAANAWPLQPPNVLLGDARLQMRRMYVGGVTR